MALSFEESKRMVAASPAMTMEASVEDASPVVDCDEDVATFSVEDQNFTRSGNYTWFDTFSDNDFSTVDTNKEITLSPTQVNITQENNSQVIPFEMPRYYDGVDLMTMTIQIHYVNANNAENYTAPINVSYSSDRIRFYWMVSNYATIKEGVLKFEIMATGAITVPSSGESKNYLWRTKPNEKLNVLKALTGTAMTDPTGDDWYTQFLATMSQKVGEAQTAATQAAQSAQEAQAVVDGLADTLANYYTKEQVDGFVTLLRDDIAKVDGLAKFDVQYDAETQTVKFLNGEKVIKTITLNTDPSAEWVTAFNKTVEAKIDEKIAPVKTELTEYKTSNDAAVKNLQDSVGNLPETLQSDYYNKQAINKLLEAKAEKTSVETVANDLTVVKNTASGLQNSIDTINGDISEIQEQLKNVKPGNKHIPAGGQSGQILRWSGDGSATWGPDYNTTYSDFKAATSSAAGGAGLVPAPAAGKQGQYLRGDGTWSTPTNTTYSDATQSAHGLMSTADKQKLDGFGAASTYREATQEAKDFNKEASREKSINKASMEVANLKATIHDYIAEHKKLDGTDVGKSLYELLEALNQSDAPEKIGELKKKYAELRAESKKLGLESKNLLDVFEKLFGQHLSTMITMAALHKMQDALRIVYQNVVEIDTAVTELRKVSEYTGKSLEEYMGRAAEQAQKLGVSISDYVNSTADWKRLGYSDEDAENLATYSTLLRNVGDNIDDVNTSSSYLISTLQGFGLLADQAEDVVNKIDAVANTQPVTAKDLGEILTRSSAAMSAANNTLEETIALGTAANAVIQDADTVGKVYADAA